MNEQPNSPLPPKARKGGLLAGTLAAYRRLLPSDDVFLRCFSAHAAKGAEAAAAFSAMLAQGADAHACHQDVRRLEHEADLLADEAKAAVHRVLITPFDHSDILHLSNGLDDIIDRMKSAGKLVLLYAVPITAEMRGMARCIQEACGELERGIPLLADVSSNAPALMAMCERIDAIESRADELHQYGLDLLLGPGVERTIESILSKEIYDTIEAVADRCEDVAKMVQGVVVKQV